MRPVYVLLQEFDECGDSYRGVFTTLGKAQDAGDGVDGQLCILEDTPNATGAAARIWRRYGHMGGWVLDRDPGRRADTETGGEGRSGGAT